MNLGIIHGFVGGGGGTEKTLLTILKALETTKHNVTLYTFSKPKLDSKKIKIKSTLPLSIPSFGLYQRAMESKLISKAKDEDILIQASGGLGIPSNQNQKIIVYCHSDFTNELNNPSTKYKGIWSLYYKSYYKMMEKFIENIHDKRIHLISNSKFIQNSIQSKYKKDSTVLFPPVNINEFSSKNKEKKVVTIGRFSNEKNIDFGIDIMKDIDSKYEIIGNTKTKSNELYYKKLQLKINENNSNEKIKLLKNLTRSELVKNVNLSKVYLHCSKETFGISVIEAISAGCIPIVPDISAHKETVPFSELRFESENILDAQKKIQNALDGNFDHLLNPLIKSIKKFDEDHFKKSFLSIIDNL